MPGIVGGRGAVVAAAALLAAAILPAGAAEAGETASAPATQRDAAAGGEDRRLDLCGTAAVDVPRPGAALQLPERPVYGFSHALPAPLFRGADVQADISLDTVEAGLAGYEHARLRFAVADKPEGAAVRFRVVDSQGNFHEALDSGFLGPEAGFPLPAECCATTVWTLEFSHPGDYLVVFELIDLDSDGAVIARDNIPVTAVGAWDAADGRGYATLAEALDHAGPGSAIRTAADCWQVAAGMSIQAAIAAAAANDTIRVAAGEYHENLVVDKPLLLLGPNAGKAGYAGDRAAEALIVNTAPAGTAVRIRATNVTFRGFAVSGGPRGLDGISFSETFAAPTDLNIVIQDNRLYRFGEWREGWGRGIHFHNRSTNDPCVHGIRILDNHVQHAEGGIVLRHNVCADVSGNRVENCCQGILQEGFGGNVLPEAAADLAATHDNIIVVADEFGWNAATGFAATYPGNGKDSRGCCGIRLNEIGEGALIVVRDNRVEAAAAGNIHAGIVVSALDKGRVRLIGNTIAGLRDGIRVWSAGESGRDDSRDPRESQTCQIIGGTITGGIHGVHITDWHDWPGHDETVRGTVGGQNRVLLDGALRVAGQSGCRIRIFNDPDDAAGTVVKLGMDLDTDIDFSSAADVTIVNPDLPAPGTVVIERLVAGNGRNCYASIQEAVADAAPGDVILVAPGTHAGDIVVTKPVALRGMPDAAGNLPAVAGAVVAGGSEECLLRGMAVRDLRFSWPAGMADGSHILLQWLDGIAFSNCHFRRGGAFPGTAVQLARGEVRGVTFDGCTFAGYGHALQGYGVDTTFRGCIVTNCGSGIDLRNNGSRRDSPAGRLLLRNTAVFAAARDADADAWGVCFADGDDSLPFHDLAIEECVIAMDRNGPAPAEGKHHAAVILRSNAGGALKIRRSAIRGAVVNLSPAGLDAAGNHWGAETPDFAALLTGDVSFAPWYADPAMTLLRYPGGEVGFLADMVVGKSMNMTVPGTMTVGDGTGPTRVAVTGGTLSAGRLQLAKGASLEVIGGTLRLGAAGGGTHTIAGTFTIYNSFGSIHIEADTGFSGDTLALISDIHVAPGVTLTVSGGLTLDGCAVSSTTNGAKFAVAVTAEGSFRMLRTALTDADVTLGGSAAELRDNTLRNVAVVIAGGATGNVVCHNVRDTASSVTDNGAGSVLALDGWGDVDSPADTANNLALTLTATNLPPLRTLDAAGNLYIRPGDAIHGEVALAALQAKIAGVEAMMGFNTNFFLAGTPGALAAVPPWEYMLSGLPGNEGVYGRINAAVGLDIDYPDAVGTDADGAVARLTLHTRAAADDGVTRVHFRAWRQGDDPLAGTRLAGFDGTADYTLTPFTLNSGLVTVDGTPPEAAMLTATQTRIGEESVDVLDRVNLTHEGTVVFTLRARDALAGIDEEDVTLTLTPAGGEPTAAALTSAGPVTIEGESWTLYTFEAEFGEESPTGVYAVRAQATDRSGNPGDLLEGELEFDRRVAVTVALQGAAASPPFTRTVTFTATDANGQELESRTVPLCFTNGVATAALADVPAGMAALSAKTAFNLRRRVECVLADGQGAAAFTGTGAAGRQLRGGDLDGDNIVGAPDLEMLRRHWCDAADAAADITGDGCGNMADLNVMKANWGREGDPP